MRAFRCRHDQRARQRHIAVAELHVFFDQLDAGRSLLNAAVPPLQASHFTARVGDEVDANVRWIIQSESWSDNEFRTRQMHQPSIAAGDCVRITQSIDRGPSSVAPGHLEAPKGNELFRPKLVRANVAMKLTRLDFDRALQSESALLS